MLAAQGDLVPSQKGGLPCPWAWVLLLHHLLIQWAGGRVCEGGSTRSQSPPSPSGGQAQWAVCPQMAVEGQLWSPGLPLPPLPA